MFHYLVLLNTPELVPSKLSCPPYSNVDLRTIVLPEKEMWRSNGTDKKFCKGGNVLLQSDFCCFENPKGLVRNNVISDIGTRFGHKKIRIVE